MTAVRTGLLALIAVFALSAGAKLAGGKLKLIFKLLLNSFLGLLLLVALDLLGDPLGLDLGVNIPNALTVGVLGIPGLALLLILRWFIHT
ncbi:MAG: pro-sigmaK processing inhibitor BofA family protein [Oscillospiraceae bacterium]|nr:pro-sigmaK processing inhibitor BofA family protein [Oscillospiraceae bacterium]